MTTEAEKITLKYGEAKAVAAMLGVTKQAVSYGIKNCIDEYIEALAKVRRRRKLKKQKALKNLARASRMAETETIEWHRQQVAKVYGHEFETFTK